MIGEKYESRTRLKVLKVGAGQRFTVQLLRSEPLGHIVHWLGRCSVLCPGNGCPACLASTGARWVGMMPVRLFGANGTRSVQLVEFSGDAWARLSGLLRLEGVGSALGSMVELTRGRSRGGLVGDVMTGAEENATKGFPDWTLLDAMATLYHLPRCLPDWDAERWTVEVRERALGGVVRALAAVSKELA